MSEQEQPRSAQEQPRSTKVASHEETIYKITKVPNSTKRFQVTVTNGRHAGSSAILTEISPRFAYYNTAKKK